MQTAAKLFVELLATMPIQDTKVPVVSNTLVEGTNRPKMIQRREEIIEELVKQVLEIVPAQEIEEFLSTQGIEHIYEFYDHGILARALQHKKEFILFGAGVAAAAAAIVTAYLIRKRQ